VRGRYISVEEMPRRRNVVDGTRVCEILDCALASFLGET
jgi:hypothetical protein